MSTSHAFIQLAELHDPARHRMPPGRPNPKGPTAAPPDALERPAVRRRRRA